MVNIKVAVRIRPMSMREAGEREEIIVRNSEKCILVTNPKVSEKNEGGDSRQRIRRFTVDYCYNPANPLLATQQAVYQEIGAEVLGNMFDGYNACVLAYGHSASGKTYTMMGDLENPGLTPKICTGLWEMIRNRLGVVYTVNVSFLEIYNEKVQDLLVAEDTNQTAGFSLRVREHPKLGPYVQGLSEHHVGGEEELLELLALGNRKRSTAATESNVLSSRSHAVFTIKFKQIGNHTSKISKVHLVDLAGSERASAIQSRARLKEGANINKSLVTLGNVISALAECCGSWQPFVPYRDSVLTWLLKDTLGGNSNTIMIATISPASSCYNDTINTLRYAKRTKRIINRPIVNEDPKNRTIRELKEEVSRLRTMLLSFTDNFPETRDGNADSNGASCNSKWQGARATQCAVALQTDDMELSLPTSLVTITPTNSEAVIKMQEIYANETSTRDISLDKQFNRNIATLDILPTFVAGKHSSTLDTPTNPVPPHVSEINAVNGTGVNRVIDEPKHFPEPYRRTESVSRDGLPRVSNRTLFKHRKVSFRRFYVNPSWIMLHRSRPDLIKSISSRPIDAPSTSSQSFAEASSQSVSENSLISSGSAESHSTRPRPQSALNLSRTSSIGDASGSSTPTQPQRPVIRKKEAKRAEIVASVTSRLYGTKKRPDHRLEALQAADKDDDDDDELEELKLCKRARMKLFDLSRKLAMAKKLRRTVDSDTQTDAVRSTLRVKEKSTATDQQGIPEVLHSATNTPLYESLHKAPEPPVVMNKVYLPNGSNLLLECGSNLRVTVPSPITNDSGSQTKLESKDQTTSPKKNAPPAPEEGFSDDSIESESLSEKVRFFFPKSYSCSNLSTGFPPIKNYDQSNFPLNSITKPFSRDNQTIKNFNNSLNFVHKRSIDSLLGKQIVPGIRIEKSLQPISRYAISGTNALFEFDPNKNIPDKIVFSNFGNQKKYFPGEEPPILYPQYKPELFNGLPIASTETITSSSCDEILPSKLGQYQENEDNLSSNTSSASTASSAASDTSSDDFVFVQNVENQKVGHELYTISENSEPSCSNRSTPLTSRSPRIETQESSMPHEETILCGEKESKLHESEVTKQAQPSTDSKTEIAKELKGSSKRINWSEMQCKSSRQFINFHFKPAFLNASKTNDKSTETNLTSEDSITFVFMGPKQNSSSVLLELIKRSLVNGSETYDSEKATNRSRSRGVQCTSKLMRSVSVDTAMIALSRFARQQQPSMDIARSNSLCNFVSDELQLILDQGKIHSAHDSGTQCDIKDETENMAQEYGVQCDIINDNAASALTISTEGKCCHQNGREKEASTRAVVITNDKDTLTDPEKREAGAQTDNLEELFENYFPELPRRSTSPILTTADGNNATREQRWKELKKLVLGTRKDLFPDYLKSDVSSDVKSKKAVKCVSWSDLGAQEDNESSEILKASGGLENILNSRRVRFSEPQELTPSQTRSPSPHTQQTVQAISAIITEANALIKNLQKNDSTNSSDSGDSSPRNRNFSSSSLLRRRAKSLQRMKINCGTQNEISPQSETSVQTDTEKTDRVVQTGSYASSLVGPPFIRSVTPMPRNVNMCDGNSNLTWPRRRISGKPPTGLKTTLPSKPITNARLGAISSPAENGRNNGIYSASTKVTKTIHENTSAIPQNTLDPQLQLKIEDSCKQLENAIQIDQLRQERLSYMMISNGHLWETDRTVSSTPEENSLRSTFDYLHGQRITPKDRLQQTFRSTTPNSIQRSSIGSDDDSPRISELILSRRSSMSRKLIRDMSQIQGSNTMRTNHNASPIFDFLNAESKKSFAGSSYIRQSSPRRASISSDYSGDPSQRYLSGINTPEYCVRPIKAPFDSKIYKSDDSSNTNGESTISTHLIYDSATDYTGLQQRRAEKPQNISTYWRRKNCRCTCHTNNFSCSELASNFVGNQCHSCCVPCIGSRDRPYHSEPALCFSDEGGKAKTSTKYTPSAHLKYLVSLRRSIIAEYNS